MLFTRKEHSYYSSRVLYDWFQAREFLPAFDGPIPALPTILQIFLTPAQGLLKKLNRVVNIWARVILGMALILHNTARLHFTK